MSIENFRLFGANTPRYPQSDTDIGPHVEAGSVGEQSSPSLYLAYLRYFSERLETLRSVDPTQQIKLAKRRPDIDNIMLDHTTQNRSVSALCMVNDLLQSFIGSVAQEPAAQQAASLAYPPLCLPYWSAWDSVTSVLQAKKTPLADIMPMIDPTLANHPATCSASAWPSFAFPGVFSDSANRARQQSAQLNPEQYRLVTQAPYFSTSSIKVADVHQLSAIQQAYFPAHYGVDISSAATKLDEVDVFATQTKLAANEIQYLLCVAGVGATNSTIVASKNVLKNNAPLVCASTHYGAVYIQRGNNTPLYLDQISGITPVYFIGGLTITNKDGSQSFYPDCYDRINRMIRLQRWTQLPFDQLDNLVVSAMYAEGPNINAALNMNAHTVRVLGFYNEWKQTYGLSAEELAAFLYQINPYAVGEAVPQFDRIFNSNTHSAAEAFVIDGKSFQYRGSSADTVTVRQLCAGLRISEAEFLFLADQVSHAQALAKDTLVRSLPVVSALYRTSRIAAYFQLSPSTLLALVQALGGATYSQAWVKQLTNLPTLASLNKNTGQPSEVDFLDVLSSVASLMTWLREQKIPVKTLLLWLASANKLPKPLSGTASEVTLINAINQQIEQVRLTKTSFSTLDLPSEDAHGTSIDWTAVLESGSVIDTNGLVCTIKFSNPNNNDEAALKEKISTAIQNTVKHGTQAELDACTNALFSVIAPAGLRQQNVSASQLAKVLSVSQTLPLVLLEWVGSNSYSLLKCCQAMAGNDPLQPNDISPSFLNLFFDLQRVAAVSTHFGLSAAFLICYLRSPSWFGVDAHCAPITLHTLYVLARYAAWRTLTTHEDAVLQYLTDANATVNKLSPQAASEQLAHQLDAAPGEVQCAADVMTGAAQNKGLLTNSLHISTLMELLTLSKRTGLSMTPLLECAALRSGEQSLPFTTLYPQWEQAALAVMATLNAPQTNH